MISALPLRICICTLARSNNAFKALALIKRNPRLTVLTSVIMPQMSGKELYKQIRSELPQIKELGTLKNWELGWT
jgi:CheY-like chemotaxis protein